MTCPQSARCGASATGRSAARTRASRALVDKGRAACLRDGFLYEAAPAGIFRLVVSFL